MSQDEMQSQNTQIATSDNIVSRQDIIRVLEENLCIDSINEQDRLREDLEADSLSVLSFLTDINDLFGISIDQNELISVTTVSDLLDKVYE